MGNYTIYTETYSADRHRVFRDSVGGRGDRRTVPNRRRSRRPRTAGLDAYSMLLPFPRKS